MMNCAVRSGTDGYNSIPLRDRLRRAFYSYLINQEAYLFTVVFAVLRNLQLSVKIYDFLIVCSIFYSTGNVGVIQSVTTRGRT